MEDILVREEGRAPVVTIDRPHRMNALWQQTVNEPVAAFADRRAPEYNQIRAYDDVEES